MKPRLPVLGVLCAAVVLSSPAEGGPGHQLLSLFGHGTIRTHLRHAKNEVPAFAVTGARHVVLMILENGSPEDARRQPFMIERAKEGMVLDQYFAVAHPSQPNYIALVSGTLAGTNGDRTGTLRGDHLGKHLPGRWKAYAEDYPRSASAHVCSDAKQDGAYVRRHVPFLTFEGVDCTAIVRLNSDDTPRKVSTAMPSPRDLVRVTQALRDDIARDTLPAFAMIIPNLTDDGHSPSNMANANDWLSRYVTPLLHDPAFTKDTVFILTFDEDDNEDDGKPNQVYTVVWGDHVKQGRNADIYDHEDLFLTIAALLHVSPLPPAEEPHSRPIGGIWK